MAKDVASFSLLKTTNSIHQAIFSRFLVWVSTDELEVWRATVGAGAPRLRLGGTAVRCIRDESALGTFDEFLHSWLDYSIAIRGLSAPSSLVWDPL